MNLDNLTDAQIRAKFIELGHPVGPVTATTRKIMLKKLKALLDSGAKPPSTSGEESDGGRLTPKGRRKAMPPPKTARSPKRKSPGRSFAEMLPVASSTFIEPPRPVKPSNAFPFDDSADNFVPSPKYSQRIGNEAFRASLNASMYNHSPPPSSSPSSSYSANSYGNDSSSDRGELRADNSDSPFSSEFLRRLTAGRSKEVSPGLSKKLLDVKESDDEDSTPAPNYAKFSQGRAPRDSPSGKVYRKTASSDAWYRLDSPVSALLLVSFVLFFGAIGVVYVNKTSAVTSLGPPRDINYVLCRNQPSHIMDYNCVKDEEFTYVELMLNILLPILNEKIAEASCSSTSLHFSNYQLQLLILKSDNTLHSWGVENNLNNLKIVFESNPKLNVKPTSEGIELTNLPQTLYCTVLSYVTVLADWIVKISVVFLILLAGYLTVRWWIRKEARHKEDVYKLAANIIEIVSSKSTSSESFVPINHVRDQLIPMKDKQKMRRLWEDALSLLESDSRLRKEVQEVEGEHFMVWRWLAANLTTNKKKVWQGQAFDTLEGNLNSHVDSPTNCLKIRHMFEAGQEEGDDWVTTVVDAILEKCGTAKILHLVVDRQSPEGLVYMKCCSPSDAGVAYRALHGSWFASNLITVKYIREHRYHERFPESVHCSKPLRPSTDSQRSLK